MKERVTKSNGCYFLQFITGLHPRCANGSSHWDASNHDTRRCVLLMRWCGLLCIQFLPQSQMVVEVRVKSAWRWVVCTWRVCIAVFMYSAYDILYTQVSYLASYVHVCIT